VCNPPPCLVMSAASRVIWLRLCVCRFDGLPLRVIGQCMYILVLLPLRQSVLAGLPVRRWSVSHCQSAAGLMVRSAHVRPWGILDLARRNVAGSMGRERGWDLRGA
jgi:hypothetical protein